MADPICPSMNLLAQDVARYHFGPVVGEVVRILVTYPSSSLQSITGRFEDFYNATLENTVNVKVSKKRVECRQLVSNALVVLLQHDMVVASETYVPVKANGPPGAAGGRLIAVLSYQVVVDNILCRIRIPLYLGFARRRFGSIGESAFRAIFERGRLTSAMLFRAAIDDTVKKLSLSVVEAEACLVDMARAGLLHWSCLRLARTNLKAKAAAAEVGKKRPRSPSADEDAEADDSGSDDSVLDSDEDDVDGVLEDGRIMVGRGSSRRKVGAPTRDNDMDVWTVSYWHLNREFRNECCVKVLYDRTNDELASHIMRAGLQLALDAEDCHFPSGDDETGDISTDAIEKQLERLNVAGVGNFWQAVEVLVKEMPRVVIPIPENMPEKLRFIPGQLIADVRQKTVDDFIGKRFQNIGRRVFKALALEGGMDEMMVAQKCMMPVKMAREQLFKMFHDRIVVGNELPRSNEQQRSANWFYLWSVCMPSVMREVQELMYKVTHNLFDRLTTVDVAGAVNEAERKRARLHETVLTGHILRMDQSIMVMRDFGHPTAAFFPAKYTVTDGLIGKVKKKQ